MSCSRKCMGQPCSARWLRAGAEGTCGQPAGARRGGASHAGGHGAAREAEGGDVWCAFMRANTLGPACRLHPRRWHPLNTLC